MNRTVMASSMNYRGYNLKESDFGIAVYFLGEWVQTFPTGEAAQAEIDRWLNAP